MSIRVSVESARGCGYRQPGGLYLVSGALSEPCSRLPIEVGACPCCGQGVKPARGFTWIEPQSLFGMLVHGSKDHSDRCPLGVPGVTGRQGLIWVGERFYPTPQAFMAEAARMGVSRRITAVPKDFKVGETWVFLGHRKGLYRLPLDQGKPLDEPLDVEYSPAIITAFRPTAIEYVVRDGEEDDAELLAGFEKRGITPVKVIRATEPLELGLGVEA